MNKRHYTPWRKLGVCIVVLLLGAVVVTGWSLARAVYDQRTADQSWNEGSERVREIEEQLAVTTVPAPSTTISTTTTTLEPVVVTEQPTVDPSTTTSTTTTTTTTTLPPLPTPPVSIPSEELFGGMTYERIGLVDGPLYEGNVADNDKAALDLGLAHLAGVPLPGGGGNVVVGGHRTTHLRPFYYLDAATIGDQITVVTTWGLYVYEVYDVQLMVPAANTTEKEQLYHTHFAHQDRSGETLTLYACTPRGSVSHRIVVHADLVSVNGQSV